MPTKGLQILYGIIPIGIFIKQTGLATYYRYPQLFNLDWAGHTKGKRYCLAHIKYWELTSTQWGLVDRGEVDGTNMIKGPGKYRVVFDSLSGLRKFLTKSQLNLYTDGSKLDESVGSGAALYFHSRLVNTAKCRLPDFATVFMAELRAIRIGVEMILAGWNEFDSRPKFVKIFCDSQAALLALHKRTVRSQLAQETMERLDELGQRGVVISLVWIKAHVNHEGNELADSQQRRER